LKSRLPTTPDIAVRDDFGDPPTDLGSLPKASLHAWKDGDDALSLMRALMQKVAEDRDGKHTAADYLQ